ncbi:MAG: DNA polymerase IV [Francisellaceae bacterium]
MTRKIIHIDMDYFYAQAEELRHPELKDKPLAVGGTTERSVLTTCNYIARTFGIHSAMPTKIALKRCPDLVVLPVDMAYYREKSNQIREIFYTITPMVEPLSLDEAFLDVSACRQFNNNATEIAKHLKQEILKKTALTASAGVAENKLLAKIASDWRKPDGLFVIKPHQSRAFIAKLAVGKLFGVGKIGEQKLNALGIFSCDDLAQFNRQELKAHFGNFADKLSDYAKGIDNRAVNPERIRKSISVEETYLHDLIRLQDCYEALPALIEKLKQRFKPYRHKLHIHSLFIKLKDNHFHQTTLERQSNTVDDKRFHYLLHEAHQRLNHPIRLIGIGYGVSEDMPDHNRQISLL